MENWTHLLAHGWWDIDLEGVLRDLLLDIERSHGLGRKRSHWTKLISMMVPLVNQDRLTDLELIVCPFAVTEVFGPCLLMVQRTKHEGPIRLQLI